MLDPPISLVPGSGTVFVQQAEPLKHRALAMRCTVGALRRSAGLGKRPPGP